MRVFDDHTAGLVRDLCDLIVPGSARVWPERYIDAILARAQEDDRAAALGCIQALAPAAGSAEALAARAGTPEFALVRALAVEAFYSDFVAPGAPGPSAYEEIDFTIELASRVKHDWSYLLGAEA
ncbi:MAG TPA: hypothetical protein VMF07_19140 [Solirubrobacteraceae bacterium]|nr:hypothetical protein [Solirubrobacteraceae bacterium]